MVSFDNDCYYYCLFLAHYIINENMYKDQIFTTNNLSHKKSAAWHWVSQLLTSILLWFFTVYSIFIIKKYNINTLSQLQYLIKNTYFLIFLVCFITIVYYHAAISIQVILEDYIKNLFIRKLLITILKITCFATTIAIILTLFYWCSK